MSVFIWYLSRYNEKLVNKDFKKMSKKSTEFNFIFAIFPQLDISVT